MTRRLVLMACCVLVSSNPIFAQSRPAKAPPDAISGTWIGALTPQNEPSGVDITMELKFDGKRTVTGSVSGLPNPADVKVGTFDPAKGALKLELGKQGEQGVLLVLEGTVVKDSATGHFSGEETGTFAIRKKR